MKKDDLVNLTGQFSERPIPATFGRHIYLWHGDLESLRTVIPQNIFGLFDLHRLVIDLPKTPYSQDEASRLLRKSIQNHLYKNTRSGQQYIILVTGCDFLSRYKVPLTDFYAIASESLMFIFIVPPEETNFLPTSPLPDYVSLNPSSTYNYLRGAIGESTTIDLAES